MTSESHHRHALIIPPSRPRMRINN